MATINSFEELEIWKKAQELGAMIYFVCNNNEKIIKDFSFKDQIKRAALSISNNIAEGFEYSNNNDFHRFLRIAKGSCGEVKSCLLFALRIGYIAAFEIENLVELSGAFGKQIGNLMKYLNGNKIEKSSNKKTTISTRNPQPATPNPQP